ncbi:KTSC domain-containing protein [Chitinophaga sp. GCM10012297]|uniref:KTSC domain-containing protein n=1 Tax=Chitinophaga chungangae TaxID=2821488 RepID=A0ABS3YG94_9BACT|nr:KTSC domain-containing protein [Chitinophaga chungangae]MBO9153338.1 KTSC domain-containing protein [Chitinophaga chungangae]
MPSSVIKYFRYDPRTAVLKITFVTGKVYEYLSVPQEIYNNMKEAFSKGQFFNKHIRDHFTFRILE